MSRKDQLEAEEQVTEYDHREFPFSERDTYPKFAVEDALAPGTNSKARRGKFRARRAIHYNLTLKLTVKDIQKALRAYMDDCRYTIQLPLPLKQTWLLEERKTKMTQPTIVMAMKRL